MFINVTAKARKIFQKYPAVKDADKAKQQALANPIYSWHCSYFTSQRHRMLCFINDATNFFVMLPNITVKDYGQLEKQFNQHLLHQLHQAGLTRQQINQYLDQAGPWEINHSVNRQALGHLIEEMKNNEYFVGGNAHETLAGLVSQLKRVNRLANSLATPELFAKAGDWVQPTEEKPGKKEHLRLQNTVQQLRYFSKHRVEYLDEDQYDDHVRQLQQLNQQLIDDFINAEQGKLSKKTLNRHRLRLTNYLNDYLSAQMATVFDDEACHVEELLYHDVSFNQAKQTRTALKKLYQYLLDQDQLSKAEWQECKSTLNQQFKDVDFGIIADPDDDMPEMIFPPSPLPANLAELTKRYCLAAVNLYGLITCDQLYRIMVKYNPNVHLETRQLIAWFEGHRRQREGFVIADIDRDPMVINPQIYEQGLSENLLAQQINKPFYLPTRDEFLKYEDPGYLPETASVKKYRQFLIQKLAVPRLQADGWVKRVRSLFNEHFNQSMDDNIHDLNDEMDTAGYACANETEAAEWLDDLMQVYQDTRLFINRGLKAGEVAQQASLTSELEQNHCLTPAIIKDMKAARRDPIDVIFTMVGISGLTDPQRHQILNQTAALPIPSLN